MKLSRINWNESPSRIVPSGEEVHLWLKDVESGQQELDYLASLLTPEERERGERFAFPRDRKRYLTARGGLRQLLSRYTGTDPGDITLHYHSHGKPYLKEGGVEFNLSHSHRLVVYAVTEGRRVGVDMEYTLREVEVEGIARRFFTGQEQKKIAALSGSLQREAFFFCWTCKEAYIKARGEGLSISPRSFEVSFGPREAAGLTEVSFDPGETGRWSLRNFIPRPRYSAALAAEGDDFDLKFWRL